ncbi:MAG TPA: hypothetical protein VNR66_12125 [Solirubrobacteraceae bacterium]|nr:hypothetical protein [Solirubrobacteraceae bacterium]
MSFSSQHGTAEHGAAQARTRRDEVRPGTYVTDGVNLYRHIVSFNPPGVRMVQLEDCMSLELLLVPAVEYRSWQVRPVIVGE